MLEILSRPLLKKQISKLLIVDLGVVLVLLAFPVRTSWDGYQQARDDLRDQELLQGDYLMRLRLAQQAVSGQPVVLGEIRAAMALLTEGERRLRPPSDAALILEEIRDLILNRGLELTTVTQQDPRRQAEFEEQQISIAVQGIFTELLRFIHALRHQETFMIVDRMILRVTEPDARRPTLILESSLRTVLVENITPFSEIAGMLGDTTAVEDEPGSDEPPRSGGNILSPGEERDE